MTTPDNPSNEPTTSSERATVRSAASSAEFPPGTRIDHYVIRERIGEGGFAVVYRAEQTEPVRRDVALKIIKLGMDTKQVIARFEAERQALAMMDHAGVARVFDAGATETGRPYFVMEYVPGDPITDYCDRHRLTNKQRLDLFIQTCEAVQHSHQKGIIHRDIKPSNVLVTVKDGAAQVKVIDFGVAKATQQRLTEQTIFTEQGQLIGTPEYMSPEQAEMRALDIDTRSDIYSLGVLLYELLVGTLPFDSKSLREAGFAEIQRIIREEEPPKPSTKLSSLGDATTGIAQRHRSDPRTLLRDLRGDLDWITMKCLEKDRTRRYEAAIGLAADIKRHLGNEPVAAIPPSALYRVSKFVRRNRATVVSAAAILVVLLLGITTTSLSLMAEAQQRRLAEDRERDANNARSDAELGRHEAVAAQRQAERQSYLANMYAVSVAFERGDLPKVHRRLAAAPASERGWEWSYFSRLADASRIALRGHDGTVWSLAFSRNGRWLASVGRDETVRLWNAVSGEQVAVFAGHNNCVALSPDGRRLVAPSADSNDMRVWDVSSGTEVCVLRGHDRMVKRVTYSPGGSLIASVSFDNTVKLWNADTGEDVLTLHHTVGVWAVAFSPDGTQIVSGSTDGTIRKWDARSGRELMVMSANDVAMPVRCVAFSADGTRLLSGAMDETIKLWDITNGAELAVLRGFASGSSVAFSVDQSHVVAGLRDGTVRLWEPSLDKQVAVLRGHERAVECVAVSPDGTQFASGSEDGTIRLWDRGSGREQVASELHGHERDVMAVCLGDEGAQLATGSLDGTARLWDRITGEELATLRHGQPLMSVALSPDSTRMASAPFREPRSRVPVDATLWNIETAERVATLRGHSEEISCLVFSPNGEHIASGSYDSTIRVWDGSAGNVVATLHGHEGAVGPVVYSPDGSLIASGSQDKTIKLWDAHSGEEIATLVGHGAMIHSIAFSPDSERLVSSSKDRTLKVWRVSDGEQITTLRGLRSGALHVAFSTDGTRIAGARGSTVMLWDAVTGDEVATISYDTSSPSHGSFRSTINSITFCSDGSIIVTANADGRLMVWNSGPISPPSHDGVWRD